MNSKGPDFSLISWQNWILNRAKVPGWHSISLPSWRWKQEWGGKEWTLFSGGASLGYLRKCCFQTVGFSNLLISELTQKRRLFKRSQRSWSKKRVKVPSIRFTRNSVAHNSASCGLDSGCGEVFMGLFRVAAWGCSLASGLTSWSSFSDYGQRVFLKQQGKTQGNFRRDLSGGAVYSTTKWMGLSTAMKSPMSMTLAQP